MASDKRPGLSVPAGILRPTTPPETPATIEPEEGQGGDAAGQGEVSAVPESKGRGIRRTKRAGSAPAEKVEGRRLYLSEDVHFRLKMLAYQRGRKISEIAQEVLDKNLPRYDVNRVG